MSEPALTEQHLDVYDTRRGTWRPEHGEVTIPEEWAFLPSGDTFVTRRVKAAGVYWLSWRPRGRGRAHRRLLGLWAPADVIERAQAAAAETSEGRARKRVLGAKHRELDEERYRAELEAAILSFLTFTEAHTELARRIAQGAACHAADVGSGRVGRTRTLPLEERATLAARAWIRHHFTDYEEQLDRLYGEDFVLDELNHRAARHYAHERVDEFLAAHRAG